MDDATKKKAGRKTARGRNRRAATHLPTSIYCDEEGDYDLRAGSRPASPPRGGSRVNWSPPRIDLTVSFPCRPPVGRSPTAETRRRLALLLCVCVASVPRHAAQSDDFLLKCGGHARRTTRTSGKGSASLD